MKIGSKLLLTYIVLIISIFFITSISFRVISERYLIHETELQLQKEGKIISKLLEKVSLSNKTVKEKLVNQRAFAISERLMTSKLLIWNESHDLIYTDLKDFPLRKILKQGKRPNKRIVTETVTISKNGKIKGYVTLIARLDEMNEINRVMRRSQLISLFISAIISLCLGIFFEKSITKPIRILSHHLKNYTIKGSIKEIILDTNDEMKELADSFNHLSRKIKKYDDDQKKFFQNASHELKTPLMAIQGNAEGILDGVVTGEDAVHGLNVIIAESQRLKNIVEEITFLAKLERVGDAFHFSRHPLAEILQESIDAVDVISSQKQIKIIVENHVFEPISMDKEKMKRAFINLLGNAIRYAESTIIIHCYLVDQMVYIDVKDDGIGFSQDEEKKVFQRFYTGNNGGSGIGLAITKAIIDGHHGTITAFHNQPKGAVFQMVFPK